MTNQPTPEIIVAESLRDRARELTSLAANPDVAKAALAEWQRLESRLAKLREAQTNELPTAACVGGFPR